MRLYQRDTGGDWWIDWTPPTGGRIRRSLRTSDHKAAKLAAAELQRATLSGESRGPRASMLTLREAFRLTMLRRDKWRNGDTATLGSNFNVLVEYFTGERSLASITEKDVRAFDSWLVSNGSAGATTRNAKLSMLRVMFEECASAGEHLVVPRIPFHKPPKGRVRTYSASELARMWGWFDNSQHPWDAAMRDLVIFLHDSGFRLGEALRLSAADVDLAHGTATAVWTKNGDTRTVPLTERAVALLAARMGNAPSLFAPITSKHRANERWRAMRSALGLGEDCVMHCFRHTAGTRIARSAHGALTGDFLGHRDPRTTRKYVHLAVEDLRAALPALTAGCAVSVPQEGSKAGVADGTRTHDNRNHNPRPTK